MQYSVAPFRERTRYRAKCALDHGGHFIFLREQFHVPSRGRAKKKRLQCYYRPRYVTGQSDRRNFKAPLAAYRRDFARLAAAVSRWDPCGPEPPARPGGERKLIGTDTRK